MEFPHRLYQLRRERGLSQEELADRLGVTRQAVQKWEAGASRPDMDNLVLVAREFDVSLDWLLTGQERAQAAPPAAAPVAGRVGCILPWRYEYRSKRTLWGQPLVHIKLQSHGMCWARGIIAVGNCATGVVAAGAFTAGIVSVGGLSVGALVLGGLAAGLLAVGGVAFGAAAIGGVAIGGLAVGGAVTGRYACGVAAIGSEIARGVAASGGRIAIGGSPEGVSGPQTFLLDTDPAIVRAAIEAAFPRMSRWLVRLFSGG